MQNCGLELWPCSGFHSKGEYVLQYLIPVHWHVIQNQIDCYWRIEEYFPTPYFSAAVVEWVVQVGYYSWLSDDSCYFCQLSIHFGVQLCFMRGSFKQIVGRLSRPICGLWSPQKNHIKLYMPKCLSYLEAPEIAGLKCPIFVQDEKSKMASKMAAFKIIRGHFFKLY